MPPSIYLLRQTNTMRGGNTMFRAGVGLVRLVVVFALTGPAGAYDFDTGAEAVAMVKRVLGEVASRGIPSNKT
jgi:hypothetical protein